MRAAVNKRLAAQQQGEAPSPATAAAKGGTNSKEPCGRQLKRRRSLELPMPRGTLTQADFRQGSQLTHSARRFVAKGIEALGRPTADIEQTIVVEGPAADVLMMGIVAVNAAFQEVGINAKLILGAACGDATRMRWVTNLAKTFDINVKTYGDFSAVGQPTDTLPLPVDGFVASFSAKVVVRAGHVEMSRRPGMRLRPPTEADVASRDTVTTLIACVERLAPEWVIFYDVDIYMEQAEPANLLLSGLGTLGYDVQPLVADGSDYGLPCYGTRRMFVGVLAPPRRFKIDTYNNFFRRMLELFGAFKMEAPSAELAALPKDHPLVLAGLASAVEVLSYNKRGPQIHRFLNGCVWRPSARIKNTFALCFHEI
jgi:hypothetical protein